jgi:hypothetical protein
VSAAHRVDEEISRPEGAPQVQPGLAGTDVGEAGRDPIRRLVVPRRHQIRRDVHAGVGQRGWIDAGGAGDAGDVARQTCFFGGDDGGRSAGADGPELRSDRGIEGARGIGENGLERRRLEAGSLPGGVRQGSRPRRVAAQRGDAGQPAQGVGDVVGGG